MDNDKYKIVIEKFKKIQEYCLNKIKEMLESGILTPAMLDFDFDEGNAEIKVEFDVVYEDGTKSKVNVPFLVDVQFNITENY